MLNDRIQVRANTLRLNSDLESCDPHTAHLYIQSYEI